MFENNMMPLFPTAPMDQANPYPLMPPAPPSPNVMTLPDGTVVPVDSLGLPGGAPDPALTPGMPPLPGAAPGAQPGQAKAGGRPLTDSQKKMIAQLLKDASEAARKGKSPLAAFLVPLASGIMQGVAARRDQKGQEAEAGAWKDSTRKMFGALADDPRVNNLMAVMNDKNAPSFARTAAGNQLDEILKGVAVPGQNPSGGGGGGGGRKSYPTGGRKPSGTGASASGGGDKPESGDKVQMYGEYNIGGFIYGRTRYGEFVPYLLPTGEKIPFGAAGGVSAGSEALQPTADPETGLLPGTGGSEPAPTIDGGPIDLPDPLGIRLPPA